MDNAGVGAGDEVNVQGTLVSCVDVTALAGKRNERSARRHLASVAHQIGDGDRGMRAGRRAEQLAERHRGDDGGHHRKASARETRVGSCAASRGTP